MLIEEDSCECFFDLCNYPLCSLSGAGTFVASGVILLYVSAWLAVWSLVVYMRKISKVLLM